MDTKKKREVLKLITQLKKKIYNQDGYIEYIYIEKDLDVYNSLDKLFDDVVEFPIMRYKNVFYNGKQAKLIFVNELENELDRISEVQFYEREL